MRVASSFAVAQLIAACSSSPGTSESTQPGATDDGSTPSTEGGDPSSDAVADVEGVTVSGDAGAYTFSVTLRSPDTGCDQYAHWWEVLGEDGSLLFRRILAHSHVDEQPFTRSGGPVDVQADTRLFVRAHMNVGGYGGQVFTGTPGGTFEAATDFDPSIAAGVETADPQPDGCAF